MSGNDVLIDAAVKVADADLIAAAPELLAALVAMSEMAEETDLGSGAVYPRDRIRYMKLRTAASAAIAHAKSESHCHPCDECGEETMCSDGLCSDGPGAFVCPDCFDDGTEDPVVEVVCTCGWVTAGVILSDPEACPVCNREVPVSKVGCGHSACSQHYIDTGSTECIQGGE